MSLICYHNINEALTLKGALEKDGRNLTPDDLSVIKKASIVCDQNTIQWIGPSSDLPKRYQDLEKRDCQNLVVTPELVDCHTHLVFGGDRSIEYARRLNGEDYQKIAAEGGGILFTMEQTRKASANELRELAHQRIERICARGVGTIEVKSGYGLNFEKEYEVSHLINELKKHYASKIQIFNTYMAAHTLPPEFSNSSQYLKNVVIPLMNKLAREQIIDGVDIFHEVGNFDADDSRHLFQAAQTLNLPVKIHADEFFDNGGAAIACEFNALSCDHLMNSSDEGIQKLSQSKTVATLLPGTSLFLGKPMALASKFLNSGCKVAIASDYNPGSSHCDDLLMLASIAAPQYGMNLAQVWAGITLNAASALGFNNQGALVEGKASRFTFFECQNIEQISYSWGRNLALNRLGPMYPEY